MDYYYHIKIILKAILLLFILFLGSPASARYFEEKYLETMTIPDSVTGDTWYVDVNNGSDSNDGKSPGTAYKTLAKCFDRYRTALNGGDVVKIMAGTYHERLKLANIFTSPGNPLIVGPYGNGRVIIDASDSHLLSWVKYNDNLFWADFSSQKLAGYQAKPNAVILNNNFKTCRPVTNSSDLISYGRWYYDEVGKKIYVHTGGIDPNSLNIIVTKFDPNNIEYGIYGVGSVGDYSYVEIYGLTVLGASGWGVWLSGDHCKIEQCDIRYSGKGGVELTGNLCEIRNNNVYGTILMNWPRGRTWDTSGGWPIALLFGPKATVYGNIVVDNGGEGIGGGGAIGETTIENNISGNNWSVNIYVDNSPNYLIRNNFVYGTTPDPSEMIFSKDIPTWTSSSSILRRMNPQGIVLGDETAANAVARSHSTKIYNNLTVGCRVGFSHYGQAVEAGLIDVIIANNTFITPNRFESGEENSGVIIPYNSGHNSGTVFKNNIIWGQHAQTPLLELRGGVNEQGVTFDNNLYFNKANSTPFIMGTTDTYNFVSWQNTLNQDLNSMYLDPKFVDVAGPIIAKNYFLKSSSPAIGKAKIFLDYSIDFNYSNRESTWDIGFVEYDSSLLSLPVIEKIIIK